MPLMKALLLAAVTTTAPVAPAPTTITAERDPDARTLCGVVPERGGCAVPAFESGRPIGFKMFGVSRRPAAQRRGFEEGDIVMRINGFSMTDPSNGLAAFESIKRCSDVRFTIKRQGRVIELLPSRSAAPR